MSSLGHISGTEKFPSMNFIERYYVKYVDFAAHEISGQRSKDSNVETEIYRVFQNLH